MSADTIRTTQQADFRSLMSQLGVNREILLAQPATVCIIGIGLSFGERALFGDYTDDGVWLPRSNVQGIWACDENDYFNLVPDSSAYAKLHRLGLSVTSVQSFIPEIQESSPMQLCHAPFGQAVRAIQKPFFDIVTFCRIPNLLPTPLYCQKMEQLTRHKHHINMKTEDPIAMETLGAYRYLYLRHIPTTTSHLWDMLCTNCRQL